jgi:nicotinate-nucleotide--dimethylbenzimidazole phosphoribosyltransferase
MRILREAIAAIQPPDDAARVGAAELQLRLTKPAGALGRLEDLHVWAAGVRRDAKPSLGRKLIVVAAADHGVVAEGVSAYPSDVTRQMLANFLVGGAAVNVLASHANAHVHVVDAGVRGSIDDPCLSVRKVRDGAGNIARGPAMTREEALCLVAAGVTFAREQCDAGAAAIGLGDMGIGNTTPAAAITSAITGAPPSVTAGRGTGIDDTAFAAKLRAIEQALAANEPDASDGLDVVSKVGGCEIAFLAGVAIGAAASSAVLVLDGYPTTAAALIAAALAPGSADYILASHMSAEPGHRVALGHLGLSPLLDLGMRLGEGTGAALALSLLDAALRLAREMATFEAAGIARSTRETRPEA